MANLSATIGNQTHSSREKETSMINSVSLHKIGIVKFAGLLVLAALAVAFFVAPIAMAIGGGGNAVASLNSSVKTYFLGRVAGRPTVGTTLSVADTKLDLSLTPTSTSDEVLGGSWFMCAVKDPATVNTFYIFKCTVSGLKGIKIAPSDVTSNRVAVILGLPANIAATTPAAMKYVGKKGRLLYTLTGNVLSTPAPIKQALNAAGTGW